MAPSFFLEEERVTDMVKKYIYYKDHSIYALYYSANDTIYYNLSFAGKVHVIIYK